MDDAARAPLEQQLARELIQGHALFGRPARALGRSVETDDVLFAVEQPHVLAVVHLTGSTSRSANAPHAMLFDDVAEFSEGCMKPDHAEYTDAEADEEEES